MAERTPLLACDYFSLSRVNLWTTARSLDDEPLAPWLVTSGQAVLSNEATGYDRSFIAGETVLIPAHSRGLRWTADQATLLRVEPT